MVSWYHKFIILSLKLYLDISIVSNNPYCSKQYVF